MMECLFSLGCFPLETEKACIVSPEFLKEDNFQYYPPCIKFRVDAPAASG